jgi:SAM-dependent methyltransferase
VSPARRPSPRRWLRRATPEDSLESQLLEITPEDRRWVTAKYDDSVPLPEGAERDLSEDSPRLRELRRAYAGLELPVCDRSQWRDEAVASFLDLRYFRGDSLITWHYRELPRITRLKYFIYALYVRGRDELGLLSRLEEDGAFGCWTFSYPGYGRVSRDLLQSVNELSFLERRLGLSKRERISVLDVGAGYGRLAHRMTEAFTNVGDYCCVDAIPESTFLSEYYLRHRAAIPPARVVPLDRLDSELEPGSFDLAVAIHIFSECTLPAIAWWVARLRALEVPRLLVVPREPTELLSVEPDWTRQDYAPVLDRAGYRLEAREPVVDDPAFAQQLGLEDHFHLFALDERA